VGPHRLYVPLAREWAANGHVVLRFDLGGIGDSAPARGGWGDPYPAQMLDDAREAVAVVRSEAPDAPVVLVGLCSGGWLAFDAARSGIGVDAIIAINAPLYLRDGGREWVREQRQLDRYQRSMRRPAKWLEALGSRRSVAAAGRAIVRRAGRSAAAGFRRAIGDALPDGLARDLQTIARRGTSALFIFSDADNGRRYFDQHAPAALRRGEIRDRIDVVVVNDAGHAFKPLAAQQQLRALLSGFVRRFDISSEPAAVQNSIWTRRPV
jgi:thioesterase domain-containing protein